MPTDQATPSPPAAASEPEATPMTRHERIRLAGAVCAAAAAALAAYGLAGWIFNWPADRFGAMSLNTAVVLLVTSLATGLYLKDADVIGPSRALTASVGLAGALSAVALAEYATGLRFGVDAVLAADDAAASAYAPPTVAGAMAAALLLHAAMVLGAHQARYGAAQVLALGTLLVATVDGTRHLFDLESSVGAAGAVYGVMTLPAVIGLALLAGALVMSHPDRGVVKALADPGLGGGVARVAVPAALLLPPALAWVVWRGVGRDIYAPGLGLALIVTLTMAVGAGVAFVLARRVRRVDDEQRAAETRRRMAEQQWHRAITDAPVPMVIHDGDQIVEMNHAWKDIAGLDAAATPSISAWVAQARPGHVPELAAFRAKIATATATVEDGEQSIRTPEGIERVWAFSTTPVGPLGTERRLFVTTAVDVTARRQSENQLQHLNEELERRITERTAALTRANDLMKRQSGQVREQTLLLDLVRDGILVRDLYGTIVYWNHGATSMYGWTPEQALGRVSHQLLAAEYPLPIGEIEKQVMRAGFWEGDVVHVTQSGHRVLVESRWTMTRTERGTPEGFLEVHRDISQRRRAERALQAKADALARSNHELEQFAYVASHDLQEPLRMVSNYTQLLARRYRDRLDADANEFIDFAVDGARRMQDLIHALLQYARVERSGREFEPVPADRIVADALSNLAGAIDEARASIVVDPLPTLTCDASQMTQVFQNLIGNAVKFRQADRPPVIRVSASREDGAWRLTVTDNGIGIEPRFFDRIFQMFQRLHGRGEYSGTGIGLALCQKIVERHGGRMGVDSEPGRGTTFSLTIPDAAS